MVIPARRRPKPDPQRLAFYVLLAFLILCGLTGGSSRADEPLSIVVRAGGMIAFIALILIPAQPEMRIIRPLGILLTIFAVAIGLQLIPLPPALWTSLPGHAVFADAATLAGMPQPWRPISIVPELTANSLCALLPAAVVLLGYAMINVSQRRTAIGLMVMIGFASVFVAILQMVGGAQSIAYFWARSSLGIITGLMGNRNHFAVYLALTIPMLAYCGLSTNDAGRAGRGLIVGCATILLAVIVLASGSRSGTIVLGLCILATTAVHRRAFRGLARSTRLVVCAVVVGGAAVIGLSYMWQRAASIDRLHLLSGDEMRFRSLPTVLRMIKDFLPFGSGFGTFDAAFRIYEPDRLLKLTYFNNAHDDWLELVLTGGLPAIFALLAFAAWFGRAAYRAFRPGAVGSVDLSGQVAVIVVVGTAIASITDYPLRTPIFAALLALACCSLADVTERSRRSAAGSCDPAQTVRKDSV